MNPHRKLLRSIAMLTLLTVSLAGCSGILPKKNSMQILSSQAQVEPDPSWPKVNWQITVARPSSNDMLNSRRMVVSPTAGKLEVYKGVSWDDNVPDIVQDIVVNAFEDSGKILATARQGTGARTDFTLQLDLRDDQAVYRTPAGPPEVTVTVTARLIDFSKSRAVASHTFRKVVPASTTAVPDVAHAFDIAWADIAHDVVGWTLTNGERARLESGQSTQP